MQNLKRIAAVIFALCLIISMVPVNVFAEDPAHDHTYENYVCTECGNIDPDYTGMLKVDGVWSYVKNGAVDTTYTGVSVNEYGYRYIVNGVFDSSKTGLIKMPTTSDYFAGKYVYVKAGKVMDSYTGLMKNGDYGWRYVVKGVWADTKTGLVKMPAGTQKYPEKYCYIKSGKFMDTFTGLMKNGSYGWRYVKNGLFDETYTGLSKNEYGYRYVVKGKFAETTTGLICMSDKSDYQAGKWIYIENGKFTQKYNGLAKNKYGWRYCKNSVFYTSYSGKANNADNTYFANVKSGKASSAYNGVIKSTVDSTWYYVKDGKIDTTFNSGAKVDGAIWKFKKGKIDKTYTGIAKYNGSNYYFQKGKVQTSYTGGVIYKPSGATKLSDFKGAIVKKGKVLKSGITMDGSSISYEYDSDGDGLVEIYNACLRDYIGYYLNYSIEGVGKEYYTYASWSGKTYFKVESVSVEVNGYDVKNNQITFMIKTKVKVTGYSNSSETGYAYLRGRMTNSAGEEYAESIFTASTSGYETITCTRYIHDVDFGNGTFKLKVESLNV